MWEWIWNNLSNIESILNVLFAILSVCTFIGGLIVGVLQLKLRRNQYKYLNLVVDRQTKQSMKYYVPTRAQDIDPNTEEDSQSAITKKLVPFFIDEIFNQSDDQYFIILADSGMGKTTFLLSLFFKYYKKIFRKFDIVFVPLALDCSIEKIREVNKKSTTILLLDGFDEDQYAAEDYANRLAEICKETELFYKVIMTCRTQFFPDCDSEPQYIEGKIKFGIGKKSVIFKKYYISPFNDKEVDLYLKKKYNNIFGKNKIKRSKKIISKCPKLMIRPMLLAYIDNLIIDETKNYDYAYEIYSELVSRWLEREPINDELLYNFSVKVAENMYSKHTTYIGVREIEDLCRKSNIQIRKIDAQSRSLLNRNANGNCKFAHKSILEFFLAQKAYNEIGFRKDIAVENFVGYDMVKIFLKEMSLSYLQKLLKDNPLELKSYSFNYLQLPNVNFSIVDIINCDFEGCDLSDIWFFKVRLINVKFVNANLQNANFSWVSFDKVDFSEANLTKSDLEAMEMKNVNLQGADLRDANLSNADLERANLQGADLQGANLANTKLQGADLRHANMKGSHLQGADLFYANIEETIFEDVDFKEVTIAEAQVAYLRKKYNLQGARVFVLEEVKFMQYEEYCDSCGF